MLRPNAPESAVRAVLDRALRHRVTSPAPPSEAESELSARNRQATEDLTARTLEIVPAPGVAVYVKDPIDLRVRGTVTWVAEAEVAHAHHHVPAVVDRVLATQESIMVGAVGTDAAPADANREAYSLLGAPVRKGDEVIGAVCAFGDGPLSVNADTLDALADAAFSWGDQKHRPDPVETAKVSERRGPERPARSTSRVRPTISHGSRHCSNASAVNSKWRGSSHECGASNVSSAWSCSTFAPAVATRSLVTQSTTNC